MKKLALVIASILAAILLINKRKTSEPGDQTKSDVQKNFSSI